MFKVDAKAKRAGKLWRSPADGIQALQRRIGCSVLVQRMMVDIMQDSAPWRQGEANKRKKEQRAVRKQMGGNSC